jgi:dephospho-CoA kinase
LKEIKLLKKLYKGNVIVIAVISSFKIRSHREIRRKRFGKSESLEYLRKRDSNEKRIGLGTLIKNADFKINNSKLSKRQMETRLVRLVNSEIIQI